MNEKPNLYYDNDINDIIYSKQNTIKINPLKSNKLSRYNSELINYLNKNEINYFKDKPSIKNIEFSCPAKQTQIIPHNNISRNITKIRLKHFYSKSISQFNKKLKFDKINNMIPTKNFFLKNKNKTNEKNIIYKPIKLKEKIYGNDKRKFIKIFYSLKRQKVNNFINNYLSKFSETEKPEKIRKEIQPIIESDRSIIKDKLPINTLKYYHKNLFHNKKSYCNCYEEEKGKINDKNCNYSQIFESTSLFNNNIGEYEIIELGGKKNYVATKLTKKKKDKCINKSKSLITINLRKKQDFHYIMKHPFSNSYFCSSFVNQLTDNNNSYTNNFSDKFQNINNPLNDKDLTDKLHNLILNPNTSKIRNGELLLMYKKFPKGTFYNIFKNNQINNNNDNDFLYNEELKKLENTKYRKYIIKLNKTMERAKNIQNLLDSYMLMNKSKVNC